MGMPGVDDLTVTVVDPENASTEELMTLHAQTADKCIKVHGIVNMISCNSLGENLYPLNRRIAYL